MGNKGDISMKRSNMMSVMCSRMMMFKLKFNIDQSTYAGLY